MTLRLVPPHEPQEQEPAVSRFVALSSLTACDLMWYRPRGRETYELRASDVLVATLLQELRGCARATGETAGGEVLLTASGGAWKRVDIHDAAGHPIGVFRERWTGGGTLVFATGLNVKLAPTNLWRSEWSWRDEAGRELLHWQHWQQTVSPPGVDASETPILTVLSWFLNLLAAQAGRAGADIGFVDEPEK